LVILSADYSQYFIAKLYFSAFHKADFLFNDFAKLQELVESGLHFVSCLPKPMPIFFIKMALFSGTVYKGTGNWR
jgi:hypothetical protein